MQLTVEPSELLDESKFTDFLKALALGASIQFAPMTYAYDGELNVAEFPADLLASYNLLDKTPKLGVVQAQQLADEAITKVGKEAVEGAAEKTEAWGNAKATYDWLVNQDYIIATAFLGRFNHDAKKLFGSQIRALPKPAKNESKELPISVSYLNEKIR